MSTEIIDTLYMNISHKNKHISIFTIYNRPKNTYTNLINHLLPKIDNEYLINKHIVLYSNTQIYLTPSYLPTILNFIANNYVLP